MFFSSFAVGSFSRATYAIFCAVLVLSLSACTESSTEVTVYDYISSGDEHIKDMVMSCNTSQKGNTVNLKLEVDDWSLKSVVRFDSTTVHEEYVLDGDYGEWANRICEVVNGSDENNECENGLIMGDYTVGSGSRKFFEYLDDVSICTKLTLNQISLEELLLK